MDLMPWMQQQGMLPAAGETVLCAVSGGRDSVCLLHYLASLGRRRGFAVAAAHYNHLMRPTAGRDEAFVAGLCRELGVPLYVERGDVRAIAGRRAGAWRRQAAACATTFWSARPTPSEPPASPPPTTCRIRRRRWC